MRLYPNKRPTNDQLSSKCEGYERKAPVELTLAYSVDAENFKSRFTFSKNFFKNRTYSEIFGQHLVSHGRKFWRIQSQKDAIPNGPQRIVKYVSKLPV